VLVAICYFKIMVLVLQKKSHEHYSSNINARHG